MDDLEDVRPRFERAERLAVAIAVERRPVCRFVVRYDMDVTDKSSKKRMQISEVGVYTVKDGKIVREEFLPYTGSEKS